MFLLFPNKNSYKPLDVADHTQNHIELRGLEGFVAAVAPFNFTAIGANLCAAPALMGNVVLWKPSDSAMLSSYVVYKILREAGLPPGVINFVPSDGPTFGDTITKSPHLAGINFTGSVPTFRWLWKVIFGISRFLFESNICNILNKLVLRELALMLIYIVAFRASSVSVVEKTFT